MKEYKLNRKLARQILNSEYDELFETIAKESKVSPTTIAAFLTETLKALKRDGVKVEKVSEYQIREVFSKVSVGELAKEAIPDVIVWLSKHENKSVKEAISALGFRVISEDELKAFIKKVVEDNASLIQEQRENSFGILMGIIMKKLRGKVDAALVSKLLKERLKKINHSEIK